MLRSLGLPGLPSGSSLGSLAIHACCLHSTLNAAPMLLNGMKKHVFHCFHGGTETDILYHRNPHEFPSLATILRRGNVFVQWFVVAYVPFRRAHGLQNSSCPSEGLTAFRRAPGFRKPHRLQKASWPSDGLRFFKRPHVLQKASCSSEGLMASRRAYGPQKACAVR